MRRATFLAVVTLFVVAAAWAGPGVKSPTVAQAVRASAPNPWAVDCVYTPDCPRPADMQELRIFRPDQMCIDAGKATMLAKRMWVDQLIGCSAPVWGPLPYRSVVIQTYSMTHQGDAFVRIDRAHGIWRPGWTWWADREMTMGVHLEQCTPGKNLVFSLFVAEKTVYKYITSPARVVEVLKRVYDVRYVQEPVCARQFIAPAGVMPVWTPAMGMNVGVTTMGQWHDLVTFTLYEVPELRCSGTPDSPYCPPGTAPPEPGPGNTNPPSTPPPVGDGGGWSGPHQPPNQPTPPGVDGQPWEPAPPPAS